MAQAYSDPRRASDPYALPDIEVFYITLEDTNSASPAADDILEPGWYWWACFPGCLPDGEPMGPFETEEEALSDAQEDAEAFDGE